MSTWNFKIWSGSSSSNAQITIRNISGNNLYISNGTGQSVSFSINTNHDLQYGSTTFRTGTAWTSTFLPMCSGYANNLSYLNGEQFLTISAKELYDSGYRNLSTAKDIVVSDEISSGLEILTISDGGHLGNIVYNSQTYSSFPAVITLDPTKTTMTATGTTYDVRLTNVNNMKQIKVGTTVVNTFPFTLSVNEDKTIEMSGEDDKTITVNYTNTSTPVVTDT